MEKTKISVAVLRLIFVFCLLMVASFYLNLSFGWFSENKEASVNGAYVKVGGNQSINVTECYVFRYTDNSVVCSLADSSQTYEMMKYDTILTDKNVNTPLFFRVVAEGIPSDGNLTVTVPLIDIDDDTVTHKFSSVASVKVAFGLKINGEVDKDTFTPNSSDNAKIFEGVRDLVRDSNLKDNYYVVSTFDKESVTLTLNSEKYSDYMCAIKNGVCDYDSTGKNALVFYIVFDYEKGLISKYQGSGSTDDDDITFSNDIGTITIE